MRGSCPGGDGAGRGAGEGGDSPRRISATPHLSARKASRPRRAMGVDTGQLESSLAFKRAGRGSGSKAILVSPLPRKWPSVFLCLLSPREEAELWQRQSCTGEVKQFGGCDWFAFRPVCPPPPPRIMHAVLPSSSPRAALASQPGRSWFPLCERRACIGGGAASSTCHPLPCHLGGRPQLHILCPAPALHASAADSARWASASCVAGVGLNRWCWHGPGWWPQPLQT